MLQGPDKSCSLSCQDGGLLLEKSFHAFNLFCSGPNDLKISDLCRRLSFIDRI